MKYFTKIALLLFFFSITISAQEENIFHNRDFWKTNPSIKTIDQKIAEGNNVSESNSNAFDGVVYAILGNVDNETIKYLLSKEGNDVNKKTHDGRTYIFWAAYKNNLDIMKFVFKKGAKTDVIDTHGNTFLNFAASSGLSNKEVYDYAFKIGADITKDKNHDGANVLLLVAPHLKDFDFVKYLISKGASLKDKDTNGNGLFEYVSKSGNISLLETLLDKGVDKGKNAMVFASQGLRGYKNTLEFYKALENIGVKVNVVNENGRNPLHYIASNSKDLETYQYFISNGVDVNLQDKGGNSPFMNAANRNTLEIVKFLTEYVKDINIKDETGESALAKAVNSNTVDVAQYLLKNGADINTKDANDNTLSYYLINNFRANSTERFEEKLNLLEKNGLVINKVQNSGNTLLHIAVQRNNLALLKRLNSFNIDVNEVNKEGLTALQIAAMKAKDDAILKYLLSIGADKNRKTDFDETVYDLASENELLNKQNINITFLK